MQSTSLAPTHLVLLKRGRMYLFFFLLPTPYTTHASRDCPPPSLVGEPKEKKEKRKKEERIGQDQQRSRPIGTNQHGGNPSKKHPSLTAA
ncbi:uncharacterized protein EAE98_004801 [Botrytis deweyae]|uniref:Secreted protein n=1 Tax=Botrytis deweyae TaxID=2478750 RepID=A0ABQ7IPC5_9HELO|nr:uncharacterized protein EAE98_004801 [Botrytis deweyae]KAF7930401.1 hypothetical protein EAE98_004801 [Botrytis deweyae]